MTFDCFGLRSSLPEVFCKKGVLRNFTKFTGKHLCQSLFCKSCRTRACNFIQKETQACNFIQKETLAQVFCGEFCEISKDTFSYGTSLVAASLVCSMVNWLTQKIKNWEIDYSSDTLHSRREFPHSWFMTSLQSQKSFLKGCQNLPLQRIIGVITPKALRYMNICNISKYAKMRTLCHAVSLKGEEILQKPTLFLRYKLQKPS